MKFLKLLYIILLMFITPAYAQRTIYFFEPDYDTLQCEKWTKYESILPADVIPLHINQFYSETARINGIKKIETVNTGDNINYDYIERNFFDKGGFLTSREVIKKYIKNKIKNKEKYLYNYTVHGLCVKKMIRNKKTYFYFDKNNRCDSIIKFDDNGETEERVFFIYVNNELCQIMYSLSCNDTFKNLYQIRHQRVSANKYIESRSENKILSYWDTPEKVLHKSLNYISLDSGDLVSVDYSINKKKECFSIKNDKIYYFCEKEIEVKKITNYKPSVYVWNNDHDYVKHFSSYNNPMNNDFLTRRYTDSLFYSEHLVKVDSVFFDAEEFIKGKKSKICSSSQKLPENITFDEHTFIYSYKHY